jgi:hypothetical protein
MLIFTLTQFHKTKLKPELRGQSPRASYTFRKTAACRRSKSQLLRMSLPHGQRDGSLRQYSRFSRQEPLLFLPNSSSVVLKRLSGPRVTISYPIEILRGQTTRRHLPEHSVFICIVVKCWDISWGDAQAPKPCSTVFPFTTPYVR